MGGGDIFRRRRRPSYLSGCMSPSCVPVHEEFSRIQTISAQDKSHHVRSRRLRKLLRQIVNESKCIYGTPPAKPFTFQYDAVSYSQNFDDGGHDEYTFRWRQVQHDVSCT